MDIGLQSMSKPFLITKHSQLKCMFACVLTIVLLAGCALEPYQAKPLDPAQTSAKLLNKDATSDEFKAYLIKQGYVAVCRMGLKRADLVCAIF
jgi:hypothetical protein